MDTSLPESSGKEGKETQSASVTLSEDRKMDIHERFEGKRKWFRNAEYRCVRGTKTLTCPPKLVSEVHSIAKSLKDLKDPGEQTVALEDERLMNTQNFFSLWEEASSLIRTNDPYLYRLQPKSPTDPKSEYLIDHLSDLRVALGTFCEGYEDMTLRSEFHVPLQDCLTRRSDLRHHQTDMDIANKTYDEVLKCSEELTKVIESDQRGWREAYKADEICQDLLQGLDKEYRSYLNQLPSVDNTPNPLYLDASTLQRCARDSQLDLEKNLRIYKNTMQNIEITHPDYSDPSIPTGIVVSTQRARKRRVCPEARVTFKEHRDQNTITEDLDFEEDCLKEEGWSKLGHSEVIEDDPDTCANGRKLS